MTRFLDQLARPDEYYESLLQINFATYASQGCKLVLLDIDNTLASHGADQADDFAREAITRIQAAGLVCMIISNAAARRAQAFAASLGVPCRPRAAKPWPHALREACRSCGIETSQAVMIGDQILTDILAARRAGCRAVLVQPRFVHEAWNVRIKRAFEHQILRRLQLR